MPYGWKYYTGHSGQEGSLRYAPLASSAAELLTMHLLFIGILHIDYRSRWQVKIIFASTKLQKLHFGLRQCKDVSQTVLADCSQIICYDAL